MTSVADVSRSSSLRGCLRCSPADYCPLYTEQQLLEHEVVVHNRCELCAEFFEDAALLERHWESNHGKRFQQTEDNGLLRVDAVGELVDIPGWHRTFEKPKSAPENPGHIAEWLLPFALWFVDEVAGGRTDQSLYKPLSEFADQAQYVNWVQAQYPKSSRAWERARYRQRARSKTAKAQFLTGAWAYAHLRAPTYEKEKLR